VRRLVREFLLPVMVALGLAFVIQSAVAKPYEIPTPSMAPTIEPNDRIIANRLIYRFRDVQRGDIIVFSPPRAAIETCGQPAGDVPFVKRVIGLPGDVVELREDGPTLVNGVPYEVPNALPNPQDKRFLPVPADHVLVLGDNRPGSCDSHQWGETTARPDPATDPFVPMSSIIGQAEVVYWPAGRIRFLD
jgi:signal peptidase I